MDKRVAGTGVEERVDRALQLAGARDGAVVMVGGFGAPGQPIELLDGLSRLGLSNLTIVSNNAGTGDRGLAALLAMGAVTRIVCSYPRQRYSQVFNGLYRRGELELELVPQGTLAERIRAGGAGIGGFYTPTGVGTRLAAGKETRTIDGREYLLEYPLRADLAIVRAHLADPWGNLTFRGSGANFAPAMAAAATTTVAQVEDVVDLGNLDPHRVDVPSMVVDHVVHVPEPGYLDKD